MHYTKVKLDEPSLVFGAPLAKQLLKEASRDNKFVELDFTAIECMDSSGINILAGFIRDLRQKGGRTKFIGVRKNIFELLRVTGLNTVADIELLTEVNIGRENDLSI